MLILNGRLITWETPNRILEGQAVLVREGKIAAIAPQAELLDRSPEEERLDAKGQIVMPGNICAHTHFYGAFSRGMAIPGPAPKDFPEILGKLWWPLDKSLCEDDVRVSAEICLVDAIRHGTTSLVDHHASPNAIPGSLDILAEAVERAGVRAVLCYEVTDRDGEELSRQGLHENVRFIERVNREGLRQRGIAASFGLHASLTLTDRTLDLCRDALPDGAGFHIHAAESTADQYDSLEKSGMRVIDRLLKHGILGPATITAHCVHVDAREVELLAASGAWVTHQPRSNMNNAVGAAQVESMLRAGVKVCLGNDGFSNTMWDEWKAAYLLHKVSNHDPRRMNGMDVQRMAAYHNADLMEVFFPGEQVGRLVPGAAADIILVDYQPPTPLTAGNLPWHILFGFNESMVTTTIIKGVVLMRDRELLTLDAEEIHARARKLAVEAWKRYENYSGK